MKGRPSKNKGIPMSEEQKKKISDTKKNKIYTEAEREVLRENGRKANLGIPRSEATKKKISESNKKPKSEEHKRNMSKSQIGKKRPNSGPKGERCAKSKLTTEQVLSIRDRFIIGISTYIEFGQEFGVSATAIYEIINRRTWTHI